MTKVTELDGLPILDAKRPISLTITPADIAAAATSKKKPQGCAAARACLRELHVKEARIHLSSIYLRTNDTNWVRYRTPASLRGEIIAFDRGGQFEPCTVTLSPRSESEMKHQNARGPNSSTGKKRKRKFVVTNVRHGPA